MAIYKASVKSFTPTSQTPNVIITELDRRDMKELERNLCGMVIDDECIMGNDMSFVVTDGFNEVRITFRGSECFIGF
ncbi:MAG: hypothetical protein NC548_13185 [Lachnospiraceae bacterium]|nr:hypothetical protein [Lachnospiraceae bacterium]MCM1230656.1 hypothetical protein [Ruminococcus flavefaciens]MCM1439988.1 hypothetical protein [Roseburia sp.]